MTGPIPVTAAEFVELAALWAHVTGMPAVDGLVEWRAQVVERLEALKERQALSQGGMMRQVAARHQ